MSSVVDKLPQQPGDSESSAAFPWRIGSNASGGRLDETAVSDSVSDEASFTAEFGAEVRSLFAGRRMGLFGQPISDGHAAAAVDTEDAADQDSAAAAGVAAVGVDRSSKPSIFVAKAAAPEMAAVPIALSIPREESATDRPAPVLSGLARPIESDEPSAAPNLFVSSAATPAEVAFVPAEEIRASRYRWLLVLLGLLAVGGAVWLTWLAQSTDTVDAPVTTIEQLTTTASTVPSTTEAPTTDATTASTTVEATVASTAPTTVATTVAPQATTPRQPATTSRPRTTAAPATTEAPTSEATIPDVTFAPPTIAPTTAAPTTAAPTTAAPTTAAPTTAAPAPTAAPPTAG